MLIMAAALATAATPAQAGVQTLTSGPTAQEPAVTALSNGTFRTSWIEGFSSGSRVSEAATSPGATSFGATRTLLQLPAKSAYPGVATDAAGRHIYVWQRIGKPAAASASRSSARMAERHRAPN